MTRPTPRTYFCTMYLDPAHQARRFLAARAPMAHLLSGARFSVHADFSPVLPRPRREHPGELKLPCTLKRAPPVCLPRGAPFRAHGDFRPPFFPSWRTLSRTWGLPSPLLPLVAHALACMGTSVPPSPRSATCPAWGELKLPCTLKRAPPVCLPRGARFSVHGDSSHPFSPPVAHALACTGTSVTPSPPRGARFSVQGDFSPPFFPPWRTL